MRCSVLLLCHSHVSRGVWALNLLVKYCFLWEDCAIAVMQLQKNTGIQGSILLTMDTLWGAYGICSFLNRSPGHFSSTYLHNIHNGDSLLFEKVPAVLGSVGAGPSWRFARICPSNGQEPKLPRRNFAILKLWPQSATNSRIFRI